MPEDTQGNNVAEENTAPAIPTEEKPAESQEPTLPDQVAERTKEEFEKLKQHNAELKSKLSQYEKPKTSVLDDLRPSNDAPLPQTPSLSQAQVEEIKSSLVDENGYVDVARLDKTLKAAEDRAKRAEDSAAKANERVQRFEENAQIRATHDAFPQVDPNSKTFDPKFYNLVKNEMVGQMLEGKTQDFLQAAKKVSEFYSPAPNVQKVKEEAVQEFKSKVTKRDNASETGTSRGVSEPTDRDELIRKTQEGDNVALYKRLQASGY